MKKILGLIVIVLIAFIGWKGWDYYQSTYVGKDYYAVIKAPMPAETDIKADNGEVIGKGFKYNVDAYAENGEKDNWILMSLLLATLLMVLLIPKEQSCS